MMTATQPCDRIIYVVDDDQAIRESLAELLEDEGYVVVTAINGLDALTKLRDHHDRPCVILLDLMMPVMTGTQFFAEQQRDAELASIPVVVISADGNVAEKAQPFGGEYLQKPVRFDVVLHAIERHCA